MIAKQYFKVFFWLFLAALLYMSLSPVPAVTPSIQNIDKMVHAGAYGLLFALAVKAYNARLPLWALAVATMVFGVSMEWAQSSQVTAMPSLWIWWPMAQALRLCGCWLCSVAD